jgi:predicted HicB family RNase H-like nuclease
MKKQPFRTPTEIRESLTQRKGQPLGVRISEETRQTLLKAAKKAGLGLSTLAAKVLDDYAEFLKD